MWTRWLQSYVLLVLPKTACGAADVARCAVDALECGSVAPADSRQFEVSQSGDEPPHSTAVRAKNFSARCFRFTAD